MTLVKGPLFDPFYKDSSPRDCSSTKGAYYFERSLSTTENQRGERQGMLIN